MPNTAPAGTSLTRTVPRRYALHQGDFGFSDGDGNAFQAVFITTLPGAGTLYYDSNGSLGGGRTAVTVGQAVSTAEILAGKLTYVAPPGASGANYDHFTFQVQDNGGVAGGGVDTDQSPNTLTFDLVASAATPPTFGNGIDLTGLSAADGFKIQGDLGGDFAGSSVSSAGDVNGDGFDDILVGAYGNDSGGSVAGAAYVIFGKASGFGALVDLTGLSASDGFKIQGDDLLDFTGFSVSSAGDVNGDGYADIIVGAPRQGSSTGSASDAEGAAYVIFGKSGGFGSLIDLTGLSSADGFKIESNVPKAQVGSNVSSAGDINGDGFDDLMLGAYSSISTVAAYVIFGKSGGFASTIDVTSLSATDGFKIQGLAGGLPSVSSAGDINGDGFDDMIVGSPRSSAGYGSFRQGAAYVIFGKSGGFASTIDVTSLSATDGFKIQGEAAYNEAGFSVSSAGDINGDGFADLLVGAYGNGVRAGAAYVIFGKSGGFGSLINLAGLSYADGFKIQGDQQYDFAGVSVSSAGDVNGDGFADIIVGASRNDGGGLDAGAAYVIFGKAGGFGSLIDLTGLSPADGFKIQGDLAGDQAGRSVSSAGDVNGDGFADLLVGAYRNDGGGSDAGAAYVIFGRANINSAPSGADGTITIPRSYTLHKADFGYSDSDGNIFQAVIVTTLPGAGTLYYDSNGALSGGRTAVTAGQAISAADILAGKLTYVAPAGASGANYDHFTFQVRDDAGTVNGGADTDPSPNTLTFDLLTGTARFGSLIDLTGLPAADGFKIQGDLAGDEAGRSVSSAGDVNGDGFDDIIVGARYNDSGGDKAGAAYVIFGKASGFGSLIDLTGLSAADGFKIQGDRTRDFAGRSVSSAGDVNGDGFADLIVGAFSGNYNNGAAYVIFGKASGFGSLLDLSTLTQAQGFKIVSDATSDRSGLIVSSAGDVNGDGFADLIVGTSQNISGGPSAGAAYVIFGKAEGFTSIIHLSTLPASDGFKIQGEAAYNFAGRSVASAGDVNGDGFADIVVGAYANSSGGGKAGAAYVIFGKASGFGSLVNLAGLSAADGFKIQGDQGYDFAGVSVSSAGDVNGDGFTDLIIGANRNGGGGSLAGAAYVIFGHAGGFGSLIDLTGLAAADGFKIQGDLAGDRAGYSVSAAGDVNGDGFADLLVGAYRNASGGTAAGAAYVIFGKASGFGSLIDLTNLSVLDGFKIQGDRTGDQAGFSVAAAGDVNGDGFDDILVGAPYNSSGGNYAGAAYVVFGRASVSDTPGIDDPAIATNDSNISTNENATVNIAVLANDFDPDGPLPSVSLINGAAIAVGGTAVLASGATVKLESDGTLTYNPNHKFDTLTTTSTGQIGATNTSAAESFTYTLAGTGGGTATVSVTVNGVANAADHLDGDSGDNTISGTGNGDYFDLSQGGNDTASGLGGNDGFFFGAAFTAADHVDGGAGAGDQIGLQGDYTGGNALVLGASTIANVELIALLHNSGGGGGFSYDITTNDGNVAAGGVLAIQATTLQAGENFTFNGSAETDGSFTLYGGLGNDNMTGGAGNDGFYFGPGGFTSGDIVNGGAGTNDQLALDGNYGSVGTPFVLGGNVTNVEVFVLLHGPNADGIHQPNRFYLTTSDAFVPAGQTITIFGVQVDNSIVFNGANEHDGAFRIYGGANEDTLTGGDGDDWIFGGGSADTINGGNGADTLYGGTGTDTMTGGAGNDIFFYDNSLQSTSQGFDTIIGFDDNADTIDLPFAVSGFAAPASGDLHTASFDSDLGTAFAGLTSHQAGMFTATGGDMNGRTFLVIDADGNAGYQAGSDYVIEIVTPVTPVDNPAIFV